jgi:hypothetical protein
MTQISSFPPNFSSTEKYANRYDLDEIDVYIEGDGKNPMFIGIKNLPSILTYGKHYFNMSMLVPPKNQDWQLRDNSRILFEFKSKNNIVLRSDITNLNQRNGIVTGYVEVLPDPLRSFEEIEDGEGALTVVAQLTNKPDVNNFLPEKYRDAINYRCTFPIEIRKNLINSNSPINTNIEHTQETIKGQFSFLRGSLTPRNSNSGMTYDVSGMPDLSFGGGLDEPVSRGTTD